ncbi:hypothetical protein [Massilia sp. BKSP1R2A-1]|uniref:hypothetical protein n=1 Tax=Massilia sp. BKSP1R2A-1 TaxID=3422595 RepID=UPI003D356E61
MKIIMIDTAALATIVQELASETIAGVGTLFLNGRADGVASLHRRLLQLARAPAPAATLADHADVIGPVAWHHQLPAGQQFLDGRNSRVVEGLQEALGHKDRFGGILAPLFKLTSVGNSETWAAEADAAAAAPVPASSLDQVVEVLEGALVEDVLPYHSPEWVERAQAVIAAHKTNRGREIGQRQRETRMDIGSDRGGEALQRQPQAYEIPTGRPVLHDIGAAMAAAAVDAAAEGHPDAHKTANEGGAA